MPDQTDYQTVSNSNTPLEVVTIFEQRAQSELSACADLTLVENGTAESPDAGPIFGVGYTYTTVGGACTAVPCAGGNGATLLGDGGNGGNGGARGAAGSAGARGGGSAGTAGTAGLAGNGSNGGIGGASNLVPGQDGTAGLAGV